MSGLESQDVYGLREFAKTSYDQKDTMHDWSHINRCYISSQQVIKFNSLRCDNKLLVSGLILHGVIYEEGMEGRVKEFLSGKAYKTDEIAKIIHVAWDSQKESRPETLEGGILHDAHLLEGDENFIITKVLVTGTARDQKLSQTVEFYFDCVAKLNPLYYFDTTKSEYENRLNRAQEFFSSLRRFTD